MAKLKKCPFCGGAAEIRQLVDRDIHGCNIGIRYVVGCIDDDGRCCMNIETGVYKKVEDAIEHWNNRVTESEIRANAIDEFAERLHELCGFEDGFYRYPFLLHESRIDEVAKQLKES
jgi:hypothetical protein